MGEHRVSFGNVTGPVQTGDGVQYVSGRDQYVSGRDQVVADRGGTAALTSTADVQACLDQISQGLAQARLTAEERAAAEAELKALQGEASPTTRPDAAAGHLEALTRGLRGAGALAGSGATLAESIVKLARWLGPLGAGVLALL
jgi:hypothetical protein